MAEHKEADKTVIKDGSVKSIHVESTTIGSDADEVNPILKALLESIPRLEELRKSRSEQDIPLSDPYWTQLSIHRSAYSAWEVARGSVSKTSIEKTYAEFDKEHPPVPPVDPSLKPGMPLPTPPVHASGGPADKPNVPSTGPVQPPAGTKPVEPVPPHASGQPIVPPTAQPK
jgi:hypothetical protein